MNFMKLRKIAFNHEIPEALNLAVAVRKESYTP